MGLKGKTVLLTRTRGQNTELRHLLTSLGARVVEIPTIEICEPETWEPVDAAVRDLERYDWVIFASANAIDAFCRRTGSRSMPKVAAVGPQTARRAAERGITVDLVPSRFRAEGLLDALPGDMTGIRVLIPRGNIAADDLPDALRARGARVDTVVVYRTSIPMSARDELRRCLENDRPDCVTFTSGSTVENLITMLGHAGTERRLHKIAVAVIGPVTRSRAEAFGLTVEIEPVEATIPALAEAIAHYFGDPNRGGGSPRREML